MSVLPRFKDTADALVVTLDRVPVREWTRQTPEIPGLGVFIRLLNEGVAEETGQGSLKVRWSAVASLSPDELRFTELPPSCPFVLWINCSGSFSDADRYLRYGFEHEHQNVPDWERTGAWLRVGRKTFTLPREMYETVMAIDKFNREEGDLESNLRGWAHILETLPEDSRPDGYLNNIRLASASAFRLETFTENGEDQLRPVLGCFRQDVTVTGESKTVFESVLDDREEKGFQKLFGRRASVARRYSLGPGHFVLLEDRVKEALEVVHEKQKAPPHERETFLDNPQAFLRTAIPDEVAVDEIFDDAGLSDRVVGVAAWAEKDIPVQPRESVGFFPDSESPEEEFGLNLADGFPPLKGASVEYKVLEIIENLYDVEYGEARKLDRPSLSELKPALAPKTELMEHQEEALEWVVEHWEKGSRGVLLADDMGLGKTLQVLAFLSCLRQHPEYRTNHPFLVVAPAGLLRNWRAEHDQHLSGIGLGGVVEAHGGGLKSLKRRAPGSVARNELVSGEATLDLIQLRKAAWVLTTYETLRDYQHSFGRIEWSVIILDEAQKIKNPATKMTDAALAMNAGFSILMTGTPVENRPADIWPLLDRAEPGSFDSLRDFSRKYEAPGKEGDTALMALNRVLLEPSPNPPYTPRIMLRRMKEELPGTRLLEKREHRHVIDMPPRQARAYTAIVNRPRKPGEVLAVLGDLRSTSLHPYDPGFRAQGSGLAANGHGMDDLYIADSARLSKAFEILRDIREAGEKVLMFVEVKAMQNFLIGALRRKFDLPNDVLLINGATPGPLRKKHVDAFQRRQGFDVMLLSPRAGGVGLTLTAANHVVHLSRWWNPAVEDQCTDRVYRIGQKRTVHVHVLIAQHPGLGKGSFDWKLDELLAGKRGRNRTVLAPSGVAKGDLNNLYHDCVGVAM